MFYNPKKVFDLVQKQFPKIKFEIKDQKDFRFTADVVLTIRKNVPLDILFDFYLTNDEVMLLFVFDKVPADINVYNAINNINMEWRDLTTYIRDDGYLVVRFFNNVEGEKEQANCISSVLSTLAGERFEELIGCLEEYFNPEINDSGSKN